MIRAIAVFISFVLLAPAALAKDSHASADAPQRNFRDCPNCPEMVTLPAGEFLMGSPESERGRGKDEGPQHKVTFAKPFAAGKYEVTFAEWDACAADGGCTQKPSDENWGRGRHPVINVSWQDATRIRGLAIEKTGKPYRLLSEAEWEYAARGVTKATDPGTPYSTGATINYQQANYDANFTYNGSPPGLYRQRTVDAARSRATHSASTRCTAMSGNGFRIATSPPTKARRTMAPRSSQKIATCTSFAAALGTIIQSFYVPRTGMQRRPRSG